MAVTSFKDFELADADREWDGDAAEKRYASGPTRKMSRARSNATQGLLKSRPEMFPRYAGVASPHRPPPASAVACRAW
jgi:hypothetical protein